MTDRSDLQWNKEEIARHLKSAVDSLTPDVLSRIDLQTPQEIYVEGPKITKMYRRIRTVATVAAACLCVAILGGGVAKFHNSRVESVIGIDVNPSIELSVNRNDRILKAKPLNDDAVEILDDMNLKNVDLNIAVNAVIGSMVRHGYFDEVENAILVTVSNEDKNKAGVLRQDVVSDIEDSLEEHKVKAVVYDQQASVTDETKLLAKKYGISYGKAYFLQELVKENDLSEQDMKAFAGMTMEEIAKEIMERSYTVRKDDGKEGNEGTLTGKTENEENPYESSKESTEASAGSSNPGTVQESTSSEAGTAPSAETTASEEETAESSGNKKVKIDFVDYEHGLLSVTFKEKVKWKTPTVSVTDEEGVSYAAKITDTGSDSCEIEIKGLSGGMKCTFVLGGVAPKKGGSSGTVKGYFDTPDIAEGAEEDDTDETEETTVPVETEPLEHTAAPVKEEASSEKAHEKPPVSLSGGE